MRADLETLAHRECERCRPAPAAYRLIRRCARDALVSVPRQWRDRERADASRSDPTHVRSAAFAGDVLRDIRVGARSLTREWRFSVPLVLVLGLAAGAAATVLSLVSAYVLRPLPFPEPERLVSVDPVVPVNVSEGVEVFERRVSWDLDVFTLLTDGQAELVRGAWVSPDFFDLFGIEPSRGRTFVADDAGVDGSSAVIISYGLWQSRYGGDPDIIGRELRAYASDRPEDAEVFTIVGVLPSDFWFFNDFTEVLAPLRVDRPIYMARLREGVTREHAEAFMTGLARQRADNAPADLSVSLTSQQERYAANVRPTLVVLSVAVSLVLVIALVNTLVLLLVRTTRRDRELAVRRVLGAGGGQLGRQLIVEGVLLAGAAVTVGVGIAVGGLGSFDAVVEARLGLRAPGGTAMLRPDMVVAAAAVFATLLLGLVFGAVPLVAGLRGTPGKILSGSARGSTDSRARRRIQSAMVAAELALSLALLLAAGLAVRSASALIGMEVGFDAREVYAAEVNLRERSYPDVERRIEFYDRLLAEVRELPGVVMAGAVVRAPFMWNFGAQPVEPEHAGIVDPAEATHAIGLVADAGYFDAMAIPLVAGRAFNADDIAAAEPVVVVSRRLAAALWPEQDPIGQRMRELPIGITDHDAGPGPWRRVVGVVGDVMMAAGPDDPADYYAPYTQLAPTTMAVVVRARSGAGSPVPALREALARLDPEVALYGEASLEAATDEATRPARFVALLLTGFSLFAVLLAMLGLYGVVSYAAAQRGRELALRMALGAEPGGVVRLFLSEAAPVIGTGVIAGVAGGLMLARLLRSQLVVVAGGEPWVFPALALLLAVAAFVATVLPARNAARADPMRLLRAE